MRTWLSLRNWTPPQDLGGSGTTIYRPCGGEVLVVLKLAPRCRVIFEMKRQQEWVESHDRLKSTTIISGDLVVSPDDLEPLMGDTAVRIHVPLKGHNHRIDLPVEDLREVDAKDFAHTTFEIPMGTDLTGYQCFRSSEPKEEKHKILILIWPKDSLPLAPRA